MDPTLTGLSKITAVLKPKGRTSDDRARQLPQTSEKYKWI